MPHITKEEVAAKRKAIKKALPEYKFQIRMKHHHAIKVRVLQGPVELTDQPDGYEDVNHFWIEKQFGDRPEAYRVISTINQILTQDKCQEVYDGDYGSVPNFYTKITIGSWDRPYQLKQPKGMTA
jgi:hypothetical protein